VSSQDDCRGRLPSSLLAMPSWHSSSVSLKDATDATVRLHVETLWVRFACVASRCTATRQLSQRSCQGLRFVGALP
jgi:hypothetical protein